MKEDTYSDQLVHCATYVELLRTRAFSHPERLAYTFLADGETEVDHLTYAQLDYQARLIAALLQERRTYGQPVLLLYQPSLEYLAAFFGCLYAGAIAVPAYPPRLNHSMERLEVVVADAQPALVLSSRTLLDTAMSRQFATSSLLGGLPIETTDTLPEDLAGLWREPALGSDTLAFLQYSSGSTGKPRGVMVSHGNLLYNQRMLQTAIPHPSYAPYVSWLPLFHDMGLIGKALQPLYCGTRSIFMSPFSFLQKPFRWLQAISRYKAYTSGAPNFAYDLCVQQITAEQRATLDLSHWRNAVNAAEPVRKGTLERFASTFADCGFRREALRPSYGLAEATLIVSSGSWSDGEKQGSHAGKSVSCGHTCLEQKIVIVDPETRQECPPEQVGEIWVSGPHVAQGYWQHPQETQETFQAHLAETGEGPFLRTGDLGFLSQGELVITGRLKDLIIIYGRNFYPQDIELTAEQSHPALRPNSNAAFSLDVAGEERIILVQEIARQYRHQDPGDIFTAIRQAVFEQHELHLHGIVLIKPGSIPKTTSGKIQRRACRIALLAHTLPVLFADAPPKVAELIRVPQTSTDEHTPVTQGTQAISRPTPASTVEIKTEQEDGRVEPQAHRSPVPQETERNRESKPMQFSLLYFASNQSALSEQKYELLLEGARFADQHEFTAVWVPERHFHPFGGLYPNPSVLAAALATTTSKIRLRAGSVVLPMHHPARVAEEWSVVDNLSSGRVDIAFATGWNPNDFILAPENYADRKEILYSGLETFNKLWRGEALSWPNGLGKETPIRIYPRPVQFELTPWITCTGNPERFSEAGALGANVLTGLLFQSVEELAEKIQLYRQARARHGHDPAQGHVTLMLHTFLDEETEIVRRKVQQPFTTYLESSVDLWRHGNEKLDGLNPQEREKVLSYAFERYFQTHALFGTPQTCEKMVTHLSEIGVDEIASLIDFGLDGDTVMDGLHWLNVLRKRSQKRAGSGPVQARESQLSISSQELPEPKTHQSLSGTDHLNHQSPNQQRATLREYLRQQIAQVLERKPEDLMGNIELRGLGLDSLKVMSIVNNCQRDLHIQPEAGLFYQHTSLESLVTHLLEEYQQNQNNPQQLTDDISLVVRRRERQVSFPQSFAQQRLWFLSQLQPDTIAYNVPTTLTITGNLDVVALQRSLEEIVRRHEILRTTFDFQQGQPVQIINEQAVFALPVLDLSAVPSQERRQEAQQWAIREVQQPFDLVRGPLIRAKLLSFAPTESLLLLTYHHIVADGWSRAILLNELRTLYAAFVAGQPSPLEDLPIQYADFAIWQLEWLSGEATPGSQKPDIPQSELQEQAPTRLTTHLNYWKKHLERPLPVLELPTDHPRPPRQTFRGAHMPIHIPDYLIQELRSLSHRENVTLFMTLLVSFQLLLARYSGQEDILIGSPIASRTRAETEYMVGSFVNTLVLRTQFAGNPTFQEILQRVREVCLGAYAHQEVPFEQVVEAVYPTRDLSRSPLFQVMFGLHEASWWREMEVAGITLRQVEMESNISAFDITWSVTTGGFGWVEYNTDLFEKETIARMLDHWYELLRSVVADPHQRIAEISFLTEPERKQLRAYWNETPHTPVQTLCFHQIFEQQARLAPTAIALQTQHTNLTYQQVENRANRLARALRQLGLRTGERVGVCMGRVPEAIICLLAILKAGGVYVPLDSRYPQERLAFMVEDAQLSVLLTQQKVSGCLPPVKGLPTLYVEDDWFQQMSEASDPLTQDIASDQLAYIIYTSGSTGNPKGVQVSHRGIQNMIEAQKKFFELKPEDRILQFSPLSFDASIWEIGMSICTGATLCLEDEESVLTGATLEAALTNFAVTVVTLPPSLLASLPSGDLPQLRTIIVAGEACPTELVARWASDRRFFNAYGPTEATVCATLEQCIDTTRKPSIGYPLDNIQVYILDPLLRPVPLGVAGELYIGGVSLAYGYLNRPELTAARFVPHPLTKQEGARLYKTGDRGRYRPDGTIEFLGRMDSQVKIHGHRIEPGEIEAVLSQHPAVQECAVVAKRNTTGEQQLIAYVVTRDGLVFAQEALYAHLQQRLPKYMLPAFILPLAQMPLTPNGKIDQKNLPDVETVRKQTQTPLALPSTATERTVASIWQTCLRLEKIGLDENFFELGGHSLLVVQVIQKMQEHFKRDIALSNLFEYPTVSSFARYLNQMDQSVTPAHQPVDARSVRQEEALKAGQNRMRNRRIIQEKEI